MNAHFNISDECNTSNQINMYSVTYFTILEVELAAKLDATQETPDGKHRIY